MKDRPILFRPALVRAILDGHKTQTRRVLKGGTPAVSHRDANGNWHFFGDDKASGAVMTPAELAAAWHCPYGEVGDRLWVRESGWLDHIERRLFRYAATPALGIDATLSGPIEERQFEIRSDAPLASWKRVPSIHMPRWACRLVLEVTDVRLERLQDITEDDAKAEGTWREWHPDTVKGPWAYRAPFSERWNQINEKSGYGWAANPWVWAITFRRVSA